MGVIEIFFKSFISYPLGTFLLFIGILNIAWVTRVFLAEQNYQKKIYQAYFLYGFFALLWVISNAYFQSSFLLFFGKDMAIFMALLANMSSNFAGIGFLYISAFLKNPSEKVSKFTWGVLIFVALQGLILNLIPGLTIQDVIITPEGQFQLIFGPLNDLFFGIGIIAVLLGFINFGQAAFKKHRNAIQNLKFYYVLAGMSLMYGSVILFDIIFPVLFQNFNYVWIPPALSIFDVLIVGYGVLTKRFRSFRLVIFKLLKAAVSLVFAGSIGYLFYSAEKFIFQELTPLQSYIVALIPALFAYSKLYAFFHSSTFSKIVGSTQVENFQKAVAEFQNQNTVYGSVHELERNLKTIFCRQLRISSASLMILHEATKKKYPELVKHCSHHAQILVSKEILFLKENEKKQIPYAQELFSLGEICLPLYHPTQSLLGFLVLGKKPHDKIYTREEIEVLSKAGLSISLNLTALLYRSELKKEVAQKTSDLRAKNRQMQEQNAHIVKQNLEIQQLLKEKTKVLAQQSDFLAMTAHEIRTPVAIAMLQSDILIMNAEDQGVKSGAEGIKNSLKKLTNLLDKLFHVLQFDLNKIEVVFEKCDVGEFIDRIYKDFLPLVKEKKIRFQLENRVKADAKVNMDPVYVRQLLQNFLTNAIKYTPEKGAITISSEENRQHYTFTVADTGPGIPNKSKKEIFKKFKSNPAMQSPSLGLGLYIAKKIATLHRGHVWVRDIPGGGALFGVDLPKKMADHKGGS